MKFTPCLGKALMKSSQQAGELQSWSDSLTFGTANPSAVTVNAQEATPRGSAVSGPNDSGSGLLNSNVPVRTRSGRNLPCFRGASPAEHTPGCAVCLSLPRGPNTGRLGSNTHAFGAQGTTWCRARLQRKRPFNLAPKQA